jgi:hypothetical protein
MQLTIDQCVIAVSDFNATGVAIVAAPLRGESAARARGSTLTSDGYRIELVEQ